MKKTIAIFISIICLVFVFSTICLAVDEKNMTALLDYQEELKDNGANTDEANYKKMLAEKIIELCSSDVEKIKEFHTNYTDNLGRNWWGATTNDIAYAVVEAAIRAVENNTNVEVLEEDAQEKLIKEIQEGLKNYKNMTLTELQKLDKKLKKFYDETGYTSTAIDNIIVVNNEIKARLAELNAKNETNIEYESTYDTYVKDQEAYNPDSVIDHNKPSKPGVLGSSSASANHSLDEMIGEAQNFLNKANESNAGTIIGSNLKAGSNTLYNILLAIGIFSAVAVGMYLGIKFMLSSAEDRAKVKESLIPYIAGCVVIFGAFIIWKLAILLLNGIA